jgi:hypothetical protein
MIINTIYNCSKIEEITSDDVVVGYCVHHSDFPEGKLNGISGNLKRFPVGDLMGFKSFFKDNKGKTIKRTDGRCIGRGHKKMNRSNISEVVKDGGEVKSFKMELFCEREDENEYRIYTKAAE